MLQILKRNFFLKQYFVFSQTIVLIGFFYSCTTEEKKQAPGFVVIFLLFTYMIECRFFLFLPLSHLPFRWLYFDPIELPFIESIHNGSILDRNLPRSKKKEEKKNVDKWTNNWRREKRIDIYNPIAKQSCSEKKRW